MSFTSNFASSCTLSRRSFVAAGAASLAALGGCAAQSPKDSPRDADDLTTINFVLDYTPNTNHTGIYVAQEKGFFADEGLSVGIMQPPADGADALIGAGSAQMGVSYQDFIANNLAAAQPLPYRAVAAIVQHNTSGIMSRAEDGITRPRNMAGHTYATWGLPVEQATVRHVVEADGGDFSQVQLVPYEVDDEVAGLRAHMFDTVWVYEGWAVQNAQLQGLAHSYFSFISVDPVFDFYTPVIAANDDFAAANPQAVQGFLRAVRRGYEFAVTDPTAAADILCEAVPELDKNLVQASQTFLSKQYVADAAKWGVIDPARWSAFYGWLNDEKLLDRSIDVNAGFTMEYLEA